MLPLIMDDKTEMSNDSGHLNSIGIASGSNCYACVPHMTSKVFQESDPIMHTSENSESECLGEDESAGFLDDYFHPEIGIIYTPHNIPGNDCSDEFNSQFTDGCECSEGLCSSETKCECLQKFGKSYDKKLLHKSKFNSAIMECHSQCLCFGKRNCENRVTQFGPASELEIFATNDGRGMALRTTKTLHEGAFICEYSGEVIDLREAKKRFRLQTENSMNYIFILNEHISNGNVLKTCIDPSIIGNIGRYINHSCEPNSVVVPVRVDTPVPNLGVFASRTISPGEEITFSYGNNENLEKDTFSKRKPCLCGAQNCRKFLPFDSALC